MNENLYLVRIKGEKYSCLGSQFVEILNIISPFLKTNVWYGADIEVIGSSPFNFEYSGWTPKRIGNIENLKKMANLTKQFLSGVFFALPNDVGETWNNKFSTEDEPFREIKPAILEIRSFDTTYFEIYSSLSEILEALQKVFNVSIINGKDI